MHTMLKSDLFGFKNVEIQCDRFSKIGKIYQKSGHQLLVKILPLSPVESVENFVYGYLH